MVFIGNHVESLVLVVEYSTTPNAHPEGVRQSSEKLRSIEEEVGKKPSPLSLPRMLGKVSDHECIRSERDSQTKHVVNRSKSPVVAWADTSLNHSYKRHNNRPPVVLATLCIDCTHEKTDMNQLAF